MTGKKKSMLEVTAELILSAINISVDYTTLT